MTTSPSSASTRHAFIRDELAASAGVMQRLTAQCAEAVSDAATMLIDAFRAGHRLLLCGNGGSAADCQHLATELVIRMNPALKRPALPAVALTADSSLLTAGANDIGYDNVFARAVEALGAEGDILLSLSTSGRSESVNRAVATARARGMKTIALLGKDGGATKDLVDLAVIVPSDDTQRIQEGHIAIGHILCALVERELFG